MPIEILVDVTRVAARTPLVALADVKLRFPEAEIVILRCPVFQKPNERPWAKLPTISSERNGKKVYAPIVSLPKELEKRAIEKILSEFETPRDGDRHLTRSLQDSAQCTAHELAERLTRLEQQLGAIRRRQNQAYVDKLDGAISPEFWESKSREWADQEQRVLQEINGLRAPKAPRMLDATRILELANKAHSLYLRQNSAEKGRLLKTVLSNCAVDSLSVYPTYRKPLI